MRRALRARRAGIAVAALLLAACDRPTPMEVVSALDRLDRAVRLDAAPDSAIAMIPLRGEAFARVVAGTGVDVLVGDTVGAYRAVVVQRVYLPPPGRPFYTRREHAVAYLWRGRGDKGLWIAGERFADTLGHRRAEYDRWRDESLGLADPTPAAGFLPVQGGTDWWHVPWRAGGGRARIAPLRDLERPCDLPLQGRGPMADSALAVRCETWAFTVELDGRFVPGAGVSRDSTRRGAARGVLPIGIARQTVSGYRFVVQCDDGPLGQSAGCGIPSADRKTAICRNEESRSAGLRDSLQRATRCWSRTGD